MCRIVVGKAVASHLHPEWTAEGLPGGVHPSVSLSESGSCVSAVSLSSWGWLFVSAAHLGLGSFVAALAVLNMGVHRLKEGLVWSLWAEALPREKARMVS